MKKGFSLIELLAAVLIIGILSSIALPQYRKAIERARSAEPIAVWNYVEKMGRIAMTERSLSNTSDSTICNTWLEQMNLTENENGCYINDHFVYCITGCTNTYVALGTCRKTPPGNFPDDSSCGWAECADRGSAKRPAGDGESRQGDCAPDRGRGR